MDEALLLLVLNNIEVVFDITQSASAAASAFAWLPAVDNESLLDTH